MVLVPFRETDVRFFDDPIHFLFESLNPLMPWALPTARAPQAFLCGAELLGVFLFIECDFGLDIHDALRAIQNF
jgi:hypothetical protein